MTKLIAKTKEVSTGLVLNTPDGATSSKAGPSTALDEVKPNDAYARTGDHDDRGSFVPKRVHSQTTEAPRLNGGGTVDFSALHERFESPTASKEAAGAELHAGVMSVVSKSGVVVGASLDGIPIAEHNFRQLEALRTSSKDGGKTWQSEWRTVTELENKPGIGMRVRTVEGIGSGVERSSLRWRAE